MARAGSQGGTGGTKNVTDAAEAPAVCEKEDTEQAKTESLFDPCAIAANLENLLPRIDEIGWISGEIRRRVQILIAMLKTRDFTEDQIAEAAAPLMLTQRHNRLLLSAAGVTFKGRNYIPEGLSNRKREAYEGRTSRLETRRKSSTEHVERHEKTLAVVKEIETQVQRALCICAPCDDPLFELYIAEVTEKDSLGVDALRLLGKNLAGNKIHTDTVVAELTRLKGEQVSSDALIKALGVIRKRNQGARYELCIGYEAGKSGRRRFYHWLAPAQGETIEEDLIPQKVWAARMLTPGKVGDKSENLRVVTNHPRRTKLLTAEIGAERGLDVSNYDMLLGKVVSSLNQAIHAIERNDDPQDREFSVRRTKRRDGVSFKMEYTLVNRKESIEEWLQEMGVTQGTIRDRVFRKMFEYKLGTEFTVEQLVELLRQDGFETNSKRVNDAIRTTAERSRNTWYEVNVRKKGAAHIVLVSIEE